MRETHTATLMVYQIAAEDVFGDVVRVHLDHRPFASAGRVIVVRHGGRSILAVARGAPKNDRKGIWLDLRCRQKLGLKPNQQADFTFQRASFWSEIRWAWDATDAMPRIAARLGIVSLVLGMIGLGLGGYALWVTLNPPITSGALAAARSAPAPAPSPWAAIRAPEGSGAPVAPTASQARGRASRPPANPAMHR